MKKILIIKTSALGDIIQTYPVLDYLRSSFPNARIDWVVEKPFAELVLAHPHIDNVITVATKAWRKGFYKFSTLKDVIDFRRQLRQEAYDVVFDLQGNIKSGLILSQVRCKQKVGFGKSTVPEWPNMLFTSKHFDPPVGNNIREDYLALVGDFFKDTSAKICRKVVLNISDVQNAAVQSILQYSFSEPGPRVIVCPGSNWRNKQLTIEALSAFLSSMQEYLKCNFILVWGSIEENEIVNQLHQQMVRHSIIIDRLSLPMVQNLMTGTDLVVAMDSLPLHLAGTTGTPSFSIFGPSLAQKYKPSGSNHFAFQGSCPYGRTFKKRCPILRTCPTGACMRELSGHDLFIKFREWWEARE